VNSNPGSAVIVPGFEPSVWLCGQVAPTIRCSALWACAERA
jgi:hypothetical protein